MFNDLIGKVKNGYKKNEIAILTGSVIFGVVLTGITAYKAGLAADEIIKRKKEDMRDTEPNDKEAKKQVIKEAVKELAPIVLPPIASASVTIFGVLKLMNGANKKIALLSTAYSMSETALRDLNDKVKTTLGDKKAREIKDSVIKDKIKSDEKPKSNEIIITGDGDVLCKDLFSDRYFKSSYQKIGSAINKLSSDCQNEMYVTLNDFYNLINLKPVQYGDNFIWRLESLERGLLPISMSAQLTDDGEPCLCVDCEGLAIQK